MRQIKAQTQKQRKATAEAQTKQTNEKCLLAGAVRRVVVLKHTGHAAPQGRDVGEDVVQDATVVFRVELAVVEAEGQRAVARDGREHVERRRELVCGHVGHVLPPPRVVHDAYAQQHCEQTTDRQRNNNKPRAKNRADRVWG